MKRLQRSDLPVCDCCGYPAPLRHFDRSGYHSRDLCALCAAMTTGRSHDPDGLTRQVNFGFNALLDQAGAFDAEEVK